MNIECMISYQLGESFDFKNNYALGWNNNKKMQNSKMK